MEVPQKMKTELSFDSSILLLGIFPQEIKRLTLKDIYTSMLIAALFTVAKTWKQLKFPWRDEQIKKIGCAYTMEYYSAIKSYETAICDSLNVL